MTTPDKQGLTQVQIEETAAILRENWRHLPQSWGDAAIKVLTHPLASRAPAPETAGADASFELWCQNVLKAEGLVDWHIKSGEAYCRIQSKTIMFDFVQYAGNYALFLHEVAHALYPHMEKASLDLPDPNFYHGGNWAAKFGDLVQRHMRPLAAPPAPADKMVEALRKIDKWADDVERAHNPEIAQHMRACAVLVRDAIEQGRVAGTEAHAAPKENEPQ